MRTRKSISHEPPLLRKQGARFRIRVRLFLTRSFYVRQALLACEFAERESLCLVSGRAVVLKAIHWE